MNKIVFITGATSGFGKACAIEFAKANYNVIITGRREERLAALKIELENLYTCKIQTLCFDVQNKEAVFTAIEGLPNDWKNVDILINNAGLALGRDNFETAQLQDWETMLSTNVNGVMYVTKALLPALIKTQGQIVNIGSIAGKEVYENGNGYCVSKHALDAISKAMRVDLLKHNIKVTVVHPGAAETEFALVRFKGEADKASATYKGFTPLLAKDVADIVFYCCTLPKHVCINDLVVTCTQQANSFYTNKL